MVCFCQKADLSLSSSEDMSGMKAGDGVRMLDPATQVTFTQNALS